MIRRQHVEQSFFEGAQVMREVLDARFKDPYTDTISWYYFCDPKMYAYLRAAPESVFPKGLFAKFMDRLRLWCMDSLGLVPMHLPYLHLMVNGCRLGLHSDFHNGAWGYVYSLTHWDARKFSGGETLLWRDGIPSYKKHHVQGEFLYELLPAQFNQLLVFDDRLVHGTPMIEGTMDPMEGRIALVGHIRATSPVINGAVSEVRARETISAALPELRERLMAYKDVQGTITYRLELRANGAVESVATLTDNVITPLTGYGHSEAVSAVKGLLQQAMARLQFPVSTGRSSVIVPLLLPLPDLRPIDIVVPHASSRESVREWAQRHIAEADRLSLIGAWEGDTYMVREPIVGSIHVDSREIAIAFDAPMWVPSQRESFQNALTEWARGTPAVSA